MRPRKPKPTKNHPAPVRLSLGARIGYAIMALFLGGATIHQVIVGRFSGARHSLIVYREDEPLYFWLLIIVTSTFACACGYAALHRNTGQNPSKPKPPNHD